MALSAVESGCAVCAISGRQDPKTKTNGRSERVSISRENSRKDGTIGLSQMLRPAGHFSRQDRHIGARKCGASKIMRPGKNSPRPQFH